MKHILTLSVLLAVVTPLSAHAKDIDDKWGLSAPLLLSNSHELSLIRGTSRGARILDVNVNVQQQKEDEQDTSVNPDITHRIDSVYWELGPRVRRYAQPDASLSPYVDLYLHGVYNRYAETVLWRTAPANSNTSSSRYYGAVLGAGMGVELFTRWGLSAALSTEVASVTWRKTRSSDSGPYSNDNLEGTTWLYNLTFQPRLYVRGYW